MQSTLIRLTACLLVILMVPAALAAFAFGLPPQYGETYLAALQDKWDALAEAEGSRVVTVGGSGMAFALRCELLEQALPGYTSVNFGLYAGLGTTVMLELAEPLLRPGDIVIFSPEQSEQTLSDYFNAKAMWQAADGRPELLAALGKNRRGPMAGAFPSFAGDKARLFRDNSAPSGEGVYARSSFNARGDIDCPGRTQNVMDGGADVNMPIFFDPALPSEDFFHAVNAFAAFCGEKGVTFYYRFCPMNAAAVAEGELNRLDEYARELQSRLDCEILGDPAQAVMDPGWFFDTNFHLNEAGAVVYTAALAADLKAALGDPTSVDIPLPDRPPLAQAELLEGDNRDEACFLYEETKETLRITGLTREGAHRETLTIPTSHDGRPVTGFSGETFAGNTVLRILTVQSNIRGMEDRSFEGCSALERIVLTHAAPEDCPVGRALLEGTQALVYVPHGRLSSYRTNYFWTVHAGRLREADGSETPPASSAPVHIPTPISGPFIHYEGNGGVLKNGEGEAIDLSIDNAHLRVNTARGTHYFQREGYVLIGWNTAADGSGEKIGLGSRTGRREELTLYAQWAKASPEEDFLYEFREDEGQAWITGYRGAGGVCVVPETVRGLPVRRICAGAFRDTELPTLVLPSGLYTVEPGAFDHCTLGDLTLFDSLREISDDGFMGCQGLTTLHVNAVTLPVYSGNYFDTFSDKYDWLLSLRGQKKLVLFSGSSGRYGYDSPTLLEAFPDYQPANMGVYAYTNAQPQLELILDLMEEGDILLSAPEFDAAPEQFCSTNRLDNSFWAMMESNYDAASHLDLRKYTGIFDSLSDYLVWRRGLESKSYGVSPANFDDDGKYYPFSTYNRYGDFILPRPNWIKDERQKQNIADYTVNNIPPYYVERLNEVYRTFLDKGIRVYFTYTPRNRRSLTEESTPEARRALHRYLTERLCVPVISDIEESLYSGIYFYLIDSHLSSEGAALRTDQVIEDLRPWIP